MDIARPDLAPRRRRRRLLAAAALLAGVCAVSIGASRVHPPLPSLPRTGLWIDTVTKGPMVLAVRGPGTLVPEDLRWIAAESAGRVQVVLLQPGSAVEPDTVVLEIENPEAKQAEEEARLALAAAEAEQTGRRAALESER